MTKEITIQELNTTQFITEKVQEIKTTVSDGIAINALSGGIDPQKTFGYRILEPLGVGGVTYNITSKPPSTIEAI